MRRERFFTLPSNIGFQVRDRETMQCVEERGGMLVFKSQTGASKAAARLNRETKNV
jgi:hypothetical protein